MMSLDSQYTMQVIFQATAVEFLNTGKFHSVQKVTS